MDCSGRLLCFFVVMVISSVAAQGQSTQGFISIDCGSSTNYTDSATGLPYVTDGQFTDTGVNYPISSNYKLSQQLYNVRSFPNATRSCYVLKPVTQFQKYIVRAFFYYGNYDGNNRANTVKPLKFDLYLDANYWLTVSLTDPDVTYTEEVIMAASENSVSVCFVNTGSGTPFVSALELRPLTNGMYPPVNSSQFLALEFRLNVGPTSGPSVRFPDDPYDRIWDPWHYSTTLVEINTTSTISNANDDYFKTPSVVMQTAATPADNSSVMKFYWTFENSGAPNNAFFVNFFFAELEAGINRTFALYLNGDSLANVTPPYLSVDYRYTTQPLREALQYNWGFNSTDMSTFPPILNAEEVFTAMNFTPSTTNNDDVDAINAIKQQYQVKRSWMADPCAPQQYPWDGLNCSYGTSLSRITSLNLSSIGLHGTISTNFAKLTELKYLDLSYNNLTGPMPEALGTLSSLQVLNVSGNNLNGTIPDSLEKRVKDGSLTLRYDGNPNLATGGTPNVPKKKSGKTTIVIICVIVVVLVILLVAVFILCKVKKSRGRAQKFETIPENPSTPNVAPGSTENVMLIDANSRQFTYKELEKITNRFTNVLGKGGFGMVFLGYLGDGTQVAVKTLSQQSTQGTKEFLAEAQNLTKIHHKNLVSLVGYCMDIDNLALVYEYMPQGTLHDHLRGKINYGFTLSWGQRLQIAIDAAQGLEYLHKGCKPPLIHRDVKSSNILLSENLEAKLSDFGLSRASNNDGHTQLATAIVGTPGYLDPEYYSSYQLSQKSDVFSFGVVLFEIITGRPPIVVSGSQSTGLAQWTRQRLADGNIEDVVDPKLRMSYDVNSIWKTADLALKCTEIDSRKRPTMTIIVVELKESLSLESANYRSGFQDPTNSNSYTEAETNPTSAVSAFEVENVPKFSPSAR